MGKNKIGFTLIELLVVITIIGILATAGTTVFTTQIQKARDTTRVTDMQKINGNIAQYNLENSTYPPANDTAWESANGAMLDFFSEGVFPADPRHGSNCSEDVTCEYVYGVRRDSNNVDAGAYEISTAFEAASNIRTQAADDNGDDDKKYELGFETGNVDTADGTYTGGLGNTTTTNAFVIQ